MGDWERFGFVDQGDGTYTIAASGNRTVGINGRGGLATDMSHPEF